MLDAVVENSLRLWPGMKDLVGNEGASLIKAGACN